MSDKYGDKIYYIIHFKEIFSEAIDENHAVYLNGHVIKYGLRYEKVKDLKIFTVVGESIIVCHEIMKAMKDRHMDYAIDFASVPCFKEDE